MCHSSTRPGTSYHVTQFYQAFPRVSTASDKRWGEKAGYEAKGIPHELGCARTYEVHLVEVPSMHGGI